MMATGMRSSVKSKYETYKKILEKKAAEVQNSMSAQKAAQVLAREEHPHDEGDLSQQSHEEWIFLNRNTLDIKLLREVQDALRRIEAGTYGVCYECDEPISVKRLDAVPWAKFCVSCQERIAARVESGMEEAFQETDA
jgi:DnaK suppressor protein